MPGSPVAHSEARGSGPVLAAGATARAAPPERDESEIAEIGQIMPELLSLLEKPAAAHHASLLAGMWGLARTPALRAMMVNYSGWHNACIRLPMIACI